MITSLNSKVSLCLSLVLLLSACGSHDTNTPPAPKAPVGTVKPMPIDQNAMRLMEDARVEVQKNRDVLVALGCDINGKDIECPTPSNYKQGKDLKQALEDYSFSLARLGEQVSNESEKSEVHNRWQAAQQVLTEVKTLINEYSLKDYQEVVVAESRLTNVGFRWQTVGSMTKIGSTSITKLTIDKEFQREHYGKAYLRAELNTYIEKLEWFLSIYGDGQNVLKNQIMREQQQKLSLAKDLASTLN